MEKIIEYYGLDAQGYNQQNVEFLDLYLGVDNLLFLDYNKILLGNSPLYLAMKGDIDAFMRGMFVYLTRGRNSDLSILIEGLHETNATHLGLSKNKPKGNSVGGELKKDIFGNLLFLRSSFLKGNLEIDSIYFGIENIGPDRISDIVTSIIKLRLIQFTQDQCLRHQIQMDRVLAGKIFDSNNLSWDLNFVNLPTYEGKPVILIPKDIVSSYASISGTFHSFIRYGFNKFFKSSPAYKLLVRGKDGKKDTDLKRKEFNEYNKVIGLNPKAVSKQILTEFDNKDLVEAFAEIRKKVRVLTDDELIEIIENSVKKAN